MSNKRALDLDDAALLEIAESSDEDVEMGQINDAKRFVYANGIKHGSDKIQATIVWKMYKTWKYEGRRQNRIHFFRDFSEMFNKVFINKATYYLLDATAFGDVEKAYWEARADLREEKRVRAKRKKDTSKQD